MIFHNTKVLKWPTNVPLDRFGFDTLSRQFGAWDIGIVIPQER